MGEYNMADARKNLEDIVAISWKFPHALVKDNASISDYFVAVRGTWLSTATKVMFVSIYAPQDISEKKSLWEYITHIIDTWDGECIILGDFNEVRSKQVRHLSDHRPIIMREVVTDYGTIPFLDGDWIDEPCKVKNEFLMHFANRFESPSGPCIDIDCHLFKKLSSEQVGRSSLANWDKATLTIVYNAQIANIIGCSTFSTPFSYLGVKVGMSPSRRKAWDEIIGKVSNRLSKWKIKTLSIGGRLTFGYPVYPLELYLEELILCPQLAQTKGILRLQNKLIDASFVASFSLEESETRAGWKRAVPHLV
ncbi:RNA-directed DNA polymerase, eukaryota [Tanacetum coccineum]